MTDKKAAAANKTRQQSGSVPARFLQPVRHIRAHYFHFLFSKSICELLFILTFKNIGNTTDYVNFLFLFLLRLRGFGA